jgi:hypothetical protein
MDIVEYTDGDGGLHRWIWWITQMDMVDYRWTWWITQMDMVDYTDRHVGLHRST